MPIRRPILLLFAAAALLPGRTYYVDGSAGSDANDGLSKSKPWKTLDRVNSVAFAPGDSILFKAGTRYTGQLHPRGSGSASRPILVDLYDDGPKPVIAAEGKFHEALLVENQDYWEISNLELTNTGEKREPFRYGVRVRAWDHGPMRHIHLKNLFVHDVNGSLVKQDRGEGHGIVWENGGDKVQSRFEDLLIESCRLLRTDRNGICGFTPYPVRDRSNRSRGVVIRRNLLEDIGGDGIKVWGAEGALVEHNVLRGARMRCFDYAAGIWPWASDNTVIQFNEVSGVKGTKDGQAFDSDANCTNSTFQYNYSHDNDGGFMLVCCYVNTGTVVRYNISQNDRTRLFHMAGSNDNISIYNNVFYIGKDLDVDLFLWTGGKDQWTHDVRILNNIFYIAGVARNRSGERKKLIDDGTFIAQPGFGGARNIVFERNILYGDAQAIPEDWKKLVADPMLSSPGSGGDGFDSLAGYRLLDGSPCIGAGLPVKDNGGRDFWGAKLPESANPSIGAHEKRAQ